MDKRDDDKGLIKSCTRGKRGYTGHKEAQRTLLFKIIPCATLMGDLQTTNGTPLSNCSERFANVDSFLYIAYLNPTS